MVDAAKKNGLADTTMIVAGVESRIRFVRGQRVMLSPGLAALYGVQTKVLLQAVKRNINRFPEDFAFQLTQDEFTILKSHFVTSSWGGHAMRHLPLPSKG